MTRREYTDTVLAALRRVTEDERRAIRAEIDGHMEDHICALLDLGYDEPLAEERTMALMGDPAEVGRELNKQYTGWGWVLLSRAAVALTIVLCIQSLMGVGMLYMLWRSVAARLLPEEPRWTCTVAAETSPDVRIPVGNDILRVYRTAVGQREGETVAGLAMTVYDRIPGGVASERLVSNLRLEDQRGDVLPVRSGNVGTVTAWYTTCYLPIQPGDTHVTLHYERFGEEIAVEIPLPEVEP
nr:permease prefix domain 1-containing protein [uncultured Dysosmobacter sp.]